MLTSVSLFKEPLLLLNELLDMLYKMHFNYVSFFALCPLRLFTKSSRSLYKHLMLFLRCNPRTSWCASMLWYYAIILSLSRDIFLGEKILAVILFQA